MPSRSKFLPEFDQNCHHCDAPISGRADKKFCDVYCRVGFHRAVKKTRYQSFYQKVKSSLNLNRRILMMCNFEGTTIVEANILYKKGFNMDYYTHHYINEKNESYHFVFETGFRCFSKGDNRYMELVKWQPYMDPQWEVDLYFL